MVNGLQRLKKDLQRNSATVARNDFFATGPVEVNNLENQKNAT
jgi:hypothetical protein